MVALPHGGRRPDRAPFDAVISQPAVGSAVPKATVSRSALRSHIASLQVQASARPQAGAIVNNTLTRIVHKSTIAAKSTNYRAAQTFSTSQNSPARAPVRAYRRGCPPTYPQDRGITKALSPRAVRHQRPAMAYVSCHVILGRSPGRQAGRKSQKIAALQTSGGSPGTGTFPNPMINAVTSAIARSAASPSGPFATSATPFPLGR